MATDTCLRGLPALFPRREHWHDGDVTQATSLSVASLGLWFSLDQFMPSELRASVDRAVTGLAYLRGPYVGKEPLNLLLEVIALFGQRLR
jgi:hypothetical protein